MLIHLLSNVMTSTLRLKPTTKVYVLLSVPAYYCLGYSGRTRRHIVMMEGYVETVNTILHNYIIVIKGLILSKLDLPIESV